MTPAQRAAAASNAWPDLTEVRLGRAVAACTLPTDPPPTGGWAAWLDRLDDSERARADRFYRAPDRDSYIAAHALLRSMLSACAGPAGPAPAAWRFVPGRNGKPRAPDCDLSFNLSHTAGLAACTVAREPDLGIDAECLERSYDGDAIPADCLTALEADDLAALPQSARMQRFLQYWTLKEALAKATGDGLGMRFDALSFALDPPVVVAAPDGIGDPGAWRFAQWWPGARHAVALAVRHTTGPEPRILVWDTHALAAWPG